MPDIITKRISIIGAGFAGICMAIRLKQSFITDFIILERSSDLGGTWRDNTYPGAACDVSSHMYSFSFEQNPNWSRMFSPQQEIRDYLAFCFDKYELGKFTRFNADVESAVFDEAKSNWTIQTKAGDSITSQIMINGMGPLNRAVIPALKGLESFTGKTFHSSHWDHTYDLANKKVAVIGTGASAIQIVPNIVSTVKKLNLFQRTAPWVIPKPDRPMKRWEQKLFRRLPFTQRLLRGLVYTINEMGAIGMVVNPKILKLLERINLRSLKKSVPDDVLREKITPHFSIGCKRILLSNTYYPALQEPHVQVITAGIEKIEGNKIITTNGQQTEVDAIVFATGFNAAEYPKELIVKGKNGTLLSDLWAGGPEAYLGTTVHGFPNMFLIIGPNTGLGHNSMIYMIESQVEHILQFIQQMQTKNLTQVDVKKDIQDSYNQEIQQRLSTTIWSSGCNSWYKTSSGKNTSIWPGFTFQFWWRVKRLREEDFEWS